MLRKNRKTYRPHSDKCKCSERVLYLRLGPISMKQLIYEKPFRVLVWIKTSNVWGCVIQSCYLSACVVAIQLNFWKRIVQKNRPHRRGSNSLRKMRMGFMDDPKVQKPWNLNTMVSICRIRAWNFLTYYLGKSRVNWRNVYQQPAILHRFQLQVVRKSLKMSRAG